MQAHRTWGSEIIFDTKKTELLITGGSQTWYSFKMPLREHLQVHLKAKQHHLKPLQHESKRLDINTNVVASAFDIFKIKSVISTVI